MLEMMMIVELILILSLIIKNLNASKNMSLIELNLTQDNVTDHINEIKCRMYSKKCEFRIKIINELNNSFDFYAVSDNEIITKLKSIQKCNNKFEKCTNYKSGRNSENFFYLSLSPKMMGKTNLKFMIQKNQLNTTINYEIIIILEFLHSY